MDNTLVYTPVLFYKFWLKIPTTAISISLHIDMFADDQRMISHANASQ